MRLVVWNCADGFARKASVLNLLQPDIAVISECRRTALNINEGNEKQICWIGKEKGRGLALIANTNWTFQPQPFDFTDQWYLTAIAQKENLELKLLGVWAKPFSDYDYLTPTLRTLDKCATFFSSGLAIVAGDFNQNVKWDRPNSKRQFKHAIAKLEAANLVSAWHSFHNEGFGQETQPTLYFRRSPTQSYHIDYVFLSKELAAKITNVEICSYTDWVAKGFSDHVPIIVDLSLE